MKTLLYNMVVGDIEKAMELERTVKQTLEETGYSLVDVRRFWNKKHGKIRVRYYDKYEPTWDSTYHIVEMPLTRAEYQNYANTALDKIVKAVKEDIENKRKTLYKLAYPDKY